MAVDNAQIARLITRYADLLEVDGANAFRIRAYRTAVRMLKEGRYDMPALVAAGKNLEELPGIGKILADKITTIVATGALPQLTKLEERVPGGLADLMQLPGLGAKHVGELYHRLGIHDLDGLRAALAKDDLAGLPGFGAKTIARLRAALAPAG